MSLPYSAFQRKKGRKNQESWLQSNTTSTICATTFARLTGYAQQPLSALAGTATAVGWAWQLEFDLCSAEIRTLLL